ncbi:MAG: DNA cytosine methyltransferase [Vicinamibacterales bacterium]
MTLTVGSVFTGIGGLDLGLERAGMAIRWQIEIDPFCREVLARHWPGVPCYPRADLYSRRAIEAMRFATVDLICGGYPCQPFSLAGRRGGTDDPRHLWPAMRRLIGILRPRYVILENVPGHLSMGFGAVLGDLAALGYDAEWDTLSAAQFGAPHLRFRLFVVAYLADADGEAGGRATWDAVRRVGREEVGERAAESRRCVDASHPNRERQQQPRGVQREEQGWAPDGAGWDASDPKRIQLREQSESERRGVGAAEPRYDGKEWDASDAARCGCERQSGCAPWGREAEDESLACRNRWEGGPPIPPLCGVDDVIPRRVDRLRTLGNAVVPEIAEWIGRRLMDAVR